MILQELDKMIIVFFRKLNAKLETYNNHFLSINARLEAIERHVKQEKRKGQAPPKPSNIPMQTVQEVIEFDSANDEDYKALVSFTEYNEMELIKFIKTYPIPSTYVYIYTNF